MLVGQEPISQIVIATTVTRPFEALNALVLMVLFAQAVASVFAVVFRDVFDQGANQSLYGAPWPAAILLTAVYLVMRLNLGVSLAATAEPRRLTLAATPVYLVLTTGTFLEHNAYSRLVYLYARTLSVALATLTRTLIRHMVCHRSWWDHDVELRVDKIRRMAIWAIRHYRGLGFKPVIELGRNPNKYGFIKEVLMVDVEPSSFIASEMNVWRAAVTMLGGYCEKLLHILESCGDVFPRRLFIPSHSVLSRLWVSTADFGVVLGLELRQYLLPPAPHLSKRTIDLVGAVLVDRSSRPYYCSSLSRSSLTRAGPCFVATRR